MKKNTLHYLLPVAVIVLFSITVLGQTTTGSGSLFNKRYPASAIGPVTGGTGKAKKAPLQSISVNEDPVFNAMTPTQLVQQAFITGCLKADNIKYGYYKKSGTSWNWVNHVWSVPNNRQMGYFKKAGSNFPIDEGIILTTGIASSAMGPNNTDGRSDLMVAGASDPDLSKISGQNMNDAAILEFDFVPAGNTMEFKYMFSSEEYLEQCFPLRFTDNAQYLHGLTLIVTTAFRFFTLLHNCHLISTVGIHPLHIHGFIRNGQLCTFGIYNRVTGFYIV